MGFHSQNGALSHYTQPPSIDAPLGSDMCDPSLFTFPLVDLIPPVLFEYIFPEQTRYVNVISPSRSETLVSHLWPDALSLSALGPHPTIKHFQQK